MVFLCGVGRCGVYGIKAANGKTRELICSMHRENGLPTQLCILLDSLLLANLETLGLGGYQIVIVVFAHLDRGDVNE